MHIGDHNGISFIEGPGGITGVCDRYHRKEVVGFREDGLIDLADPPRPVSEYVIGGALPGSDGKPFHLYTPTGFGRSVSYEALEHDEPGVLAVRLTIGLPDRTLYRVHWQTFSQDDDVFTLADGISVTVSSSLPWVYQGSTLQVHAGPHPGKVVFVVESRPPSALARDVAIVVCEGYEREALVVRAGCGRGFVPCFVLPEQQWSQRVAEPGDVLVGPGARPDIDLLPPGAPTLLAPDDEAAYGPALALAVAHQARLVLTGEGAVITLTGDSPAQWHLADILSQPLEVFGTSREVVVAESTLTDLVICQAVGYADLKQCGLAFVPAITDGTSSDATVLARECAAAVPSGLRELNADVLVVITRAQALHLTPLPDGRHWADRYLVAHLPGQVASILLRRPREPTPPVLFGVVFDALRAFTSTEGDLYQDKLATGLSAPLVLSRGNARLDVLREVLQRVDVDLLLVIAHGEQDHFADSANDEISDSLIRTWQLRGAPVVFNNSCSSWTTTGEAFLAAGARAVAGTLWPVTNDLAAGIGTSVAESLHDQDLLTLMHQAVREAADPDAAAYVYVGLPGTRFLAREILDEDEMVALLSQAMDSLFRCLNGLAAEGKVAVATALHDATVPALRARFGALATPGELPAHLPPPSAQATVIDVDYLLANASLSFYRAILPTVSPQRSAAVVEQIRRHLGIAHHELVTWPERHRAWLAASQARRPAASDILLTARFAGAQVLPFASLCAELRRPDEARHWLGVAAELIGASGNQMVLDRIRSGVVEHYSGQSPSDPVTIDWLAEALDRSLLAQQFGLISEQLGDTSEAIAFYQAAVELSPAGSAAETQVQARLRNLRGPQGDPLIEYVAAFETAVGGDDYCTVGDAATDLLKYAAGNSRSLSDELVRRALAHDVPHGGSHHQVVHRLKILGAALTYFAAHNDPAGVEAAVSEVFSYVGAYESSAVVPLNELAAWHYGRGDLTAAIATGLAFGTRLREARCFESAARMLSFTARVIPRAYSAAPDPKLLEQLFDVSATIGRLLTEHVEVGTSIGDRVDDVLEQTESVWRQLADRDNWRLALRGYQASTRWPGVRRIDDWELLAKANHPRNLDAVRTTFLVRDCRLRIEADLTVTRTTSTTREGSSGPGTIYALCPLADRPAELRGPGATFVAGTAVFALTAHETVTIEEIGVQVLSTADGWSTYRGRWGSNTVPHRLRIDLAPGLIPAVIRCEQRGRRSSRATVRFDETGGHIDVRGEYSDEAWVADVTVVFARSPELGRLITSPDLPFSQELPAELYTLMMADPPR
ncbi:hypothetical protein [Kribbella sp. NPDC051137]|uniref:hypothetical protein n=1 Tax=Kribbella sp. NPDC051137 TaxID=3155045 RepID=UPI0034127B4A